MDATYDGFSTDDWIDEDGRTWQVQVQWAVVNGRIEVVAFTLAGAEVPGVYTGTGAVIEKMETGAPLRPIAGTEVPHVTSTVLRKLPFGAIVSALSDEYRGLFELPDLPRERTGSSYEDVAAIYIAAANRMENPTKAVADELGISRTAAGKRVARARERGLLPPTEQGKAKGVISLSEKG